MSPLRHLRDTLADCSGSVADPEGSQKAPQGSPDDGSEIIPQFGQMFDDFRSYVSFKNELENEPEIVKNYIQNISSFFYYVL